MTIKGELRGYLETAEQELRRAAAITSQTLRFHRQSTNPSEVRDSDLFDGTLQIYMGRISNAAIHVEKRYREGRPVLCFEGEIRQVLNNLVGNAIGVKQGGRSCCGAGRLRTGALAVRGFG